MRDTDKETLKCEMERNLLIRIPSTYPIKLSREWINLASFRRVEVSGEAEPPSVRITWDNGDKLTYLGVDAIAILKALEEARETHRFPVENIEQWQEEKQEEEEKVDSNIAVIIALAAGCLADEIAQTTGHDPMDLLSKATKKAWDLLDKSSEEELDSFLTKHFAFSLKRDRFA